MSTIYAFDINKGESFFSEKVHYLKKDIYKKIKEIRGVSSDYKGHSIKNNKGFASENEAKSTFMCDPDFCLDQYLLEGSGSFFQVTWDTLLNNWTKPPDDPNQYPYTQTLTIPGSSITVDLTMSRRPRNDNSSTTFSNVAWPSTGPSTINDVDWTSLLGDDEVFRYFKDNAADDNPVTMTMTFSEPIFLYEMVTGNPSGTAGTVIFAAYDDSIAVDVNQDLELLSANTVPPNPAVHPNPGIGIFETATDDPTTESTVSFFAHNDMGSFDWGVSGDLTNPAPAPMNFMETYPNGSTNGEPIIGYKDGYYYNLTTATARDWLVMDYAGAKARSISWQLFRETLAFQTDLGNGSATFSDIFSYSEPGNRSAYLGPFQVESTTCPDQNHEICLDGSGQTSVDLIVDVAKTSNVVWFNSADVQVGTGNTLTVSMSTSGMATDSMETFYYTGTDIASGCAGQSCCPILVSAVSCCPMNMGLTNKSCSDNGTGSTADDYIHFQLNPTGTHLSGTYSVSVSSGSITPTSGSYGVATTFQLQNGSIGAGDITLTITDDSDNSCTLDTLVIDPGICVLLELIKTASVAAAGEGDIITYTYQVTNNSLDTLSLSDITDDKLGTIVTEVIGDIRVVDQLQSLYRFEDGSGTTITDNSGVSPALDLTIQGVDFTWGVDSLDFTDSNRADNTTDNNKLYQSITTSGALTVEAWVQPANNTQGGASRLFSLSTDNNNRNFQLMQNQSIYEFRLRTSDDGTNEAETAVGTIGGTPALQHVVYTFDGATSQFYINGSPVTTSGVTNPTGDFSTWDATYDVAIGNENGFAADDAARDWQGEFHMVAVYSKALSAAEVSQNYTYGLDFSVTPTVLTNGQTASFTASYEVQSTDPIGAYKNIANITGTPNTGGALMAIDSAEVILSSCDLTITTTYSENCTEPTTNNYTADWKIGINTTDAPDNAISYQRNSEIVQTHTLAGTTDTLTITGIPADGGIYDTLKVWFTNEVTCADTIILKRPIPCPTAISPLSNCSAFAAPGAISEPTCDGNRAWNNIVNLTTDDATFATTNGNLTFSLPNSNCLEFTDFGFSIPATATIKGINISVRRKGETDNSTVDKSIQLLVGGIASGADKAGTDLWSDAAIAATYGGENDLWGTTLTPTDVNASNFGFTFQAARQAGTGEARIEYVEMSICYSDVATTEAGGAIYEDWNFNGVQDEQETSGVQGVQVLAYDCDNNLAATTYTDIYGNYKFTGLTAGADYRIEFILPEAVACWAKPTQSGANNGTTVQFVQAGNLANLGLINLADYCQENPQLVSACFTRGDIATNGAELAILSSFDSEATNTGTAADAHSTSHNINVPLSDVGSIWGLAYAKNCDNIFAATTVKTQTEIAIDGIGAIYVIDNSTNTNILGGTNAVTSANLWLDLEAAAIGINLGDNPYDTEAYTDGFNREAYAAVGKNGIGDIDVAEDGSALFATNLYNRTLLEIPIGANCTAPVSGSEIKEIALPTPISCTDVIRPWAVKVNKGKVYVGLVCSGEQAIANNDDRTGIDRSVLIAYVYEYDPISGTFGGSPVLEFPLDYDRTWTSTGQPAAWYPWFDRFVWDMYFTKQRTGTDIYTASYAQPVLSDIEFDGCNMIIGLMDRSGNQFGYGPPPNDELANGTIQQGYPAGATNILVYPGGDLLMAGANADGTWSIENDGSITSICGDKSTLNGDLNDLRNSLPEPHKSETGSGPGGNEFLWGDYYGTGHAEVTIGGLAIRQGSGEVISMAWDPLQHVASEFGIGGAMWLNTNTGAYEKGLKLYTNNVLSFQKGSGFGDAELICGDAPIEIGNYVWEDTDEDGIQEACEPGIENVRVELYSSTGVLLAFDTTDANGQYYFSHSDAIDQNWVAAMDSVAANTVYHIVVGRGDFTSNYLTLSGKNYTLTTDSLGSSENKYAIDSDGEVVISSPANAFDNLPATEITTGDWGCVDHSIDFGFFTCTTPTVTALAIQSSCTDGTPNSDGYLQLSSVTDGDRVAFSTGNTFTGDTDYANATVIGALPFQFVTGLSNPSGTQDYTVRIFNGESSCFTDSTVTLQQVYCSSNCATNLLVNPDFELQNSNSIGASFPDLRLSPSSWAGWTRIVNNGSLNPWYALDNGASTNPPGYYNSQSGSKHFVGIGRASNSSNNGISQTFAVTNGKTYTVTFYHAPGIKWQSSTNTNAWREPAQAGDGWQVDVTGAGAFTQLFPVDITDLDLTDGALNPTEWTEETFQFTATADGNATLDFVTTIPSSSISLYFLDNVSVCEGPCCELSIINTQSDNCFGDDTNGYTADWEISFLAANVSDNAISYQRNSDAVQSHTLTGTTDTLIISGIPADGGIYDTLKVWFTNETTCGDTIILKRPVSCPSTVADCTFSTGFSGNSGLSYTDDFFGIGVDASGTNPALVSGVTYAIGIGNGRMIRTNSGADYSADKDGYFLYLDGDDACVKLNLPIVSPTCEYEISFSVAAWDADGVTPVDVGVSVDLDGGGPTIVYSSIPIGCSGFNDYYKDEGDNEDCSVSTSGHSGLFVNAGFGDIVNSVAGDLSGSNQLSWRRITYKVQPRPGDNIYLSKLGGGTTTGLALDDICVINLCDAPNAGEVCASIAVDEIAGTVFEDWNYDGSMNSSDTIGVAGVQVFIFDDCNSVLDTTYTDANGNYQFTGLTTGTTYRIAFSLPETVACWAKPTQAGADNGTTVQFVEPGNCASLGIAAPAEFCQTTPQLAVPCYINGDPVTGGSQSGVEDWLVVFDYNNTGNDAPQTKVTGEVIGSTWGVAYHREANNILAGAFLKRHVGLGASGTGAIYKINPSTGASSLLVDLNSYANVNTGTNPRDGSADNVLPTDPTAPSVDLNAFAQVGKIGLGDIDLSEDEATLFAINLFEKTLVKIPIDANLTAPASVESFDIGTAITSLFTGADACGSAEDYRPFGLKIYRGKAYVGAVCSAETSKDETELQAYIIALDLSNTSLGFEAVHTFPLTFPREGVDGRFNDASEGKWRPWESDDFTNLYINGNWTVHPSPILSDIDFDSDGSMVLGFVDRLGHQVGFRNYRPIAGTTLMTNAVAAGDVLRVCNIDGTYLLEGNGGCPTNGTGHAFYTAEEFYPNETVFFGGGDEMTDFQHSETSNGGIALNPATNRIIISVMDPLPGDSNSGGVETWNSKDGSVLNEYELFDTGSSSGTPNVTFGKSHGLGDLEMLCESAPIEIGNYVWEDTDEDGIQDACEAAIDNVIVTLYNTACEIIAIDTTDSQGQYYFNETKLRAYTAQTDTILTPNTTYYVVVTDAVGGTWTTGDSTLTIGANKYNLTTSNQGSNDLIDSDATKGTAASACNSVTDGYAFVTATTGDAGCVDHSFDIGFRPNICEIPLIYGQCGCTPTACNITIQQVYANSISCTGGTAGTIDMNVIVNYVNAPAGDIDINGTTFTPTSTNGIDTFLLTGIPCLDKDEMDVVAEFVNNSSCRDSINTGLEAVNPRYDVLGWDCEDNSGSQLFSNWLGTGLNVTISHSDNMYDGVPNIYDVACPNGNDDSHCLTEYHGSLRYTNNRNSAPGQPRGTATGKSFVKYAFDQPVFVDDFFIGSISVLAGNTSEWVHVKAYDTTGALTFPAHYSTGAENCKNTGDLVPINVIPGSDCSIYAAGVSDGTNAGDKIYGHMKLSYSNTPLDSIVIEFWGSANNYTDPEGAHSTSACSATINTGVFEPATCICCPEITELITTRLICAGENVDTLAALTTFENSDSIAFVYFATAQTDSSVIYTGGTGIDTVQISASNDTARITDVSGFTNTGSSTQQYFVYAIAHPTPSDNTCRPYEEIIVNVKSVVTVSIPDVEICAGETATITATVGNTGSKPSIYTWTVPAGESNPGNVLSFSASTPGTYTLSVYNNGCTVEGTATLTEITCAVYDYGDLPDIANGTTGINDYETYDSTGGPSHQIITGLFLGDTVDVDNDGFPHVEGLGDDNDGVDDEDGIIIFSKLNPTLGGTIRLPLSVTNTTGDTAYVEAWIDWNGDGDFEDANEMVADLKDNKDGVFPVYITIPIPVTATTGSLLGFRIRLSNTDNMTPYGRVNSGEVEDYLLGIDCPQVICLPIEFELKKK